MRPPRHRDGITSGPSGEIHDPTATFAFTFDDPSATLECRLDGEAVAPGTHTFHVRAADAVGKLGLFGQPLLVCL